MPLSRHNSTSALLVTDRGLSPPSGSARLGLGDEARLAAMYRDIVAAYPELIGYPASVDFGLPAAAAPFLGLSLNNIGDPYQLARCAHHTKGLEQEVVAFFADLFRAGPGEVWGYVTGGGSEGNQYGLYVARERHPGAVCYYSAAAHYSVPHALHLLRIRGVAVAAQPSGEMDYAALEAAAVAQPGPAAIAVATVGTTLTEARDDVRQIRAALVAAGVRDIFVHCDGALAAPYAALLDPRHPFDFGDGCDAIAVSGHKFFGVTMPCGVVLVRRAHRDRVAGDIVPYLGTHAATISGSRSGHTPILLWCALKAHGIDGLRQRALDGMRLAEYATDRLSQLGWPAWRNPGALTVVLATPPPLVTARWMMPAGGAWSHLVCMPGMTAVQVDGFIADLVAVCDIPPSRVPDMADAAAGYGGLHERAR